MKINSSNSLQFQLIEKIKRNLPANTLMAEEIADLLGVSSDSVYRRIRGETALTIDEVYKLCTHYKISFDSLCSGESDVVSFQYDSFHFSETGFKKYLVSIRDHLKQISATPGTQIIYLAEDLPLFYYFKYHELVAFIMYYWMKSLIGVPNFENKKFDPNIISPELFEIGSEICDLYFESSSVEIWTDGTIDSLIKQIEYCWESGHFVEKQDALTICQQLKNEIDFVQTLASRGNKLNISVPDKQTGNYQLFQCELGTGNNCILIANGENKAVYITHHTFNKLLTTNKGFCTETEEWLNGLIRKSILLSGTSEKQRYQFFNGLQKKLDQLVEKING
jgi:hypothetical protein